MSTFADLALLPTLQGTLTGQGITSPTEIQARTIPELLAGRSVVGVAETGSGKTLAYVLPVLHALKALEAAGSAVENPQEPRAAVIVPTRELGEQVSRVFKAFTHETRLRVRTALGGAKMAVARENVKGPFEVLVATPGRLIQLLDQGRVGLGGIRFLVLDEADQLLDLGFLPNIVRMAALCPPERQVALFSATMPAAVESLVAKIVQRPVVVKSHGSHRTVASLITENRAVVDGKRFELLQALLDEGLPGSTLLFVNTRAQCDKLIEQLREADVPCAVYRGEMDKNERRANLAEFREGRIDLLVSTDLGSRGLDVPHVARVINYHLPRELPNYLHRAGRTARAGRAGVVINFVTERDEKLVRQLEAVRSPKARRS